MILFSKAHTKSSVTMCLPRPTLINHASRFMDCSSSRPISPSVSGVSAKANTTTSAPASASVLCSLLRTSSTPTMSMTRFRTTVIRQSNGVNIRTRDSAIPPPPKIVTLALCKFLPIGPDHETRRAYEFKPRIPANISDSAISATGSAYTPLAHVHKRSSSIKCMKFSMPANGNCTHLI